MIKSKNNTVFCCEIHQTRYNSLYKLNKFHKIHIYYFLNLKKKMNILGSNN